MKSIKKFNVLIPVYNPEKNLLDLIEKLSINDCISGIIIINDGSKDIYDPIFSSLLRFGKKITLLKHAVNLGKGAALKTGLNYAYNHFSQDVGVVTADADGQHVLEDILRVGHELCIVPQALIIGTRQFNHAPEKNIPFRNKMGNMITKWIFQFIVGQKIADTQSGLRGIPYNFIPTLLKINNNGYEFELNMLICCKQMHRRIREIPIKTVYFNNNNSHFSPIIDSLKIYFVLFRFLLLSLLTSILDFTVFAIFSLQGFSVLHCQVYGRLVGILFNYPLARSMVFLCRTNNKFQFTKYITLVIMNCSASLALIHFFVSQYSYPPILVKILVESIFCIANFAIQRDFVFTKKEVSYEN